MGLPSKRRTSRSKHDRASHFALPTTAAVACASCGKATLPHRACPDCGTYRGRKVVAKKKVQTKKAAK